jgi:hypothetical protein
MAMFTSDLVNPRVVSIMVPISCRYNEIKNNNKQEKIGGNNGNCHYKQGYKEQKQCEF